MVVISFVTAPQDYINGADRMGGDVVILLFLIVICFSSLLVEIHNPQTLIGSNSQELISKCYFHHIARSDFQEIFSVSVSFTLLLGCCRTWLDILIF